MGFGFYWRSRHNQPATAPGRVLCRLRRPGRRAGEGIDSAVRQYSQLQQVAATAGSAQAMSLGQSIMRELRRVQGGLVLQESGALCWFHTGVALNPRDDLLEPPSWPLDVKACGHSQPRLPIRAGSNAWKRISAKVRVSFLRSRMSSLTSSMSLQ